MQFKNMHFAGFCKEKKKKSLNKYSWENPAEQEAAAAMYS